MRRATLIAISAVCLLAAGCGGKTVSPTAETVVGDFTHTATGPSTPKLPQGDAQAGSAVFTKASCGGCHTLKDAGATGAVGPNLDDLAPALDAIQAQVLNGGGGMPPYKGELSDQEIADVSQYVYESTHGQAAAAG
jgi:mono/diheme cytochrome c family protein